MQQDEVPKSLVGQGIVRAAVYLSEASWLTLEDFCEKLGAIMCLPELVYDGENEYQWGFVHLENGYVEINISRLNEPDPFAPVDYTLSLMASKAAAPGLEKTWLEQILLPNVEAALKLLRETNYDTHADSPDGS